MLRPLCRHLSLWLPLVLLASCEVAKSSNPLSPTVAGPIAGVWIEPPGAVSPSSSAEIAFPQQPITLTVSNAQSNGVRPLTYLFEIATDSGFQAKVFTQSGVAPGDNGQTSFRLPATLPAERSYYWRAMADDGANSSTYTDSIGFRVYTPVVIQPPSPRDPTDGATLTTRRPTLTIGNSSFTGPAGSMQYNFEIATDSSMSQKINNVLVGQGGGGQTTYTPDGDLPAASRFYWRARAFDGKVTSDFSGIRSFVTPAGTISVPPPSSGSSSSGGGVAVDQLNMGQATILNSPLDLANWPITSALTTVDIRSTGIRLEFSKKDGPGRWPDVVPPGWDGPLQYTLGMCMNIGKWYCSAPMEYWNGLLEGGGEPWNYATNWFYDPGRWAPMTYHQPQPGETIGFFVCAGDCRNQLGGGLSPVKERTNVVLVPMPGNGGAVYHF